MPLITQSRVRLLEVDPDLGADLSASALADATAAFAVPCVDAPPGPLTPDELLDEPDVRGRLHACFVVDGLLTRGIAFGDRTCTSIHGPGDYLSLDDLVDSSLPMHVEYTALAPIRLALLDDHFLASGQRWPRVTGAVMSALTAQLGRLSADLAISQLPRVEDRLIAIFLHLADRWGRRRGDDLVLELRLTHEALGKLIGARRPTVSLGLTQLAEDGLLHRDGDGWVLSAEAVERIGARHPRTRRPSRVRPVPDLPAVGLTSEATEGLEGRIAALRIEFTNRRARVDEALASSREIRARVISGRAERAPERTPGA